MKKLILLLSAIMLTSAGFTQDIKKQTKTHVNRKKVVTPNKRAKKPPAKVIAKPDLKVDRRAMNMVTCRDYEGKAYKTITIGSQVWMAENLETMHAPDGTPLEDVLEYSNNVYPAMGKQYTWYEAMNYLNVNVSSTPDGNHQGICPNGWHIPSKQEWEVLLNHLGGPEAAGGKLKETGTTHWNEPNEGATNESGFTALGAGWAAESEPGGKNLGYNTTFWSKNSSGGPTYGSGNKAWKLGINHINTTAWLASMEKTRHFSVRCIKD